MRSKRVLLHIDFVITSNKILKLLSDLINDGINGVSLVSLLAFLDTHEDYVSEYKIVLDSMIRQRYLIKPFEYYCLLKSLKH